MNDIEEYNGQQSSEYQLICNQLQKIFNTSLPKATSKVWHGAPVWFLDGNPIVGYSVRKAGVTMLFWSGQSFEESELQNEGSFKAAQKVYTKSNEIKLGQLKRWLVKSKRIQWDYKNIVKKKGRLDPLKGI